MGLYDRVIAELEAEIERRYGGKRLGLHIRSVAGYARRTARRIAPKDSRLAEQVYVAGLAHDLYKDYGQAELREFILSEGVPLDSDTWRIGAGLLHAAAAAHHLRTRLGVTDREILDAVYYHTTSRAGAGRVAKILFCADYLEPNRPQRAADSDSLALGRRLARDLEAVYGQVLSRKLIYTVGKGKPLHPDSLAAWNEFSMTERSKKKPRKKS